MTEPGRYERTASGGFQIGRFEVPASAASEQPIRQEDSAPAGIVESGAR